MPAYNFPSQFAEMIQSGEKPHTIRPPRRRPTRPGDTLYLYAGMRTKNCRLLRTEVCTAVRPVKLLRAKVGPLEFDAIAVGGQAVHVGEIEAFALREGFSNSAEMFRFLVGQYGYDAPLELIEWDPFD